MTLSLSGNHAFITGGSSGIGLAIVKNLVENGIEKLFLVSRETGIPDSLLAHLCRTGCKLEVIQADLSTEAGIKHVCRACDRITKLDILVHAAGAVLYKPFEEVALQEFDAQLRLNLAAPFFLTQNLLPALRSSEGQLAFVNSSVIQKKGPSNLSVYSAAKSALKVIADTIRTEENKNRIRVFSIYPGRTATLLFEGLCEEQGKEYRPSSLLQPEDIAVAMVQMLKLPKTGEVTDMQIRPFLSAW